MRADVSDNGASKSRKTARLSDRAARRRRPHLRALVLEGLEARQLLSTVPAPTQEKPSPTTPYLPQYLSSLNGLGNGSDYGSVNSTMVAVDPAHPDIMVAVYERNDSTADNNNYYNPYGSDTVYVQAEYSTNGGTTWKALNNNLGDGTPNFTATSDVPDFAVVSNPTVAFDAHDNFYILDEPREANYGAGELLLNRFSINPSSGAITSNGQNPLYQWNTGGSSTTVPVGPSYPAFQPIVAVDGNQNGVDGQTDANANVNGSGFGAVYVAFAMESVAPSTSTAGSYAAIYMMASADGGNSFTAGPSATAPTTGAVTRGSFYGAGNDEAASPSIAISQGGDATGGQINLVWDDYGLGSNDEDIIEDTTLTYNGTALTEGATNEVAATFVRAATNTTSTVLTNPDSASTPASPLGIGPGAVVVSDNTLGGPYEGRLYVAYVNDFLDSAHTGDAGDDAADTNIFVATSTNGGGAWSSVRASDSNMATNGTDEGDDTEDDTGNSQFMPAIAVDPVTGEVAVSYYDARNDAANARVATYVNVSIDGGSTFSVGNYANASTTATDAITGTTVNLGPIPDNQSAGNTLNRDTTYGFGDSQGLAFYDGVIIPVWASNQNGGATSYPGAGSVTYWSMAVGRMYTTAGPRIVSSTMGPVGLTGDTVNTTTNAVDGSIKATAFQVTFDRAIEATSFLASDVTITYTNPAGTKTSYNATSISPSSGTATTFTVTFTPTADPVYGFVGTYSYTITPSSTAADTPQTDIPYINTAGAIVNTGQLMDQSAVPTAAGSPSNTYVVTASPGMNELPLIVPGPHVTSMTETIGSATSSVLDGIATVSNPAAADALVTVNFDRYVQVSTFTAATILQIMGPSGEVPLTGITVAPVTTSTVNGKTAAKSFVITIPNQTESDAQWLSGTYTITLASSIEDTYGNGLDTNLNAGVYATQGSDPTAPTTVNTYTSGTDTATDSNTGLADGNIPQAPYTSTSTINVPTNYLVQGITVGINISYSKPEDLTAILQGPGGQQVVLFSGVGATGVAGTYATGFNVTLSDTLLNGTAITAVTGTAGSVISGSYYPQTSMGNSFVTGAYDSSGNWSLIVESSDSSGSFSGLLNSWTLNLSKSVIGTGLGESIADQYTGSFRVLNTAANNLTSTQQWTSIGASPLVTDHLLTDGNAYKTGLVGALAVDPSDPSGNTVYAGGATGGVWKTTNFLTTNINGPTWIPLTPFGPTSQVNVGAITIVPQKNSSGVYDPSLSIIIVGLGDGDLNSRGDGFLISDNGGATFQQVTGTSPGDTTFSANYSYVWKIAVDPNPNPVNDKPIIYAAMGGSSVVAGLWKSTDGGEDWSKLSLPIASDIGVTDVTLDPLSGIGGTSNLQILYAGVPGGGVYASSNAGASWVLMGGGIGDPLIQNDSDSAAIPVVGGTTPVGNGSGRILLAKPALTAGSTAADPSLQDDIYEGWLYALVSDGGSMDGLYVTEDYGQNWTKVLLPFTVNGYGDFPSNNPSQANNYTISTGGGSGFGTFDLAMAVDPSNPYIIYISGSSSADSSNPTLLRVNIQALQGAHSFVSHNNDNNDGGLLQYNAAGGVTLNNDEFTSQLLQPLSGQFTNESEINLIRDPSNPFQVNSTLTTQWVQQFNNTGQGAIVETYLSGDDTNDGASIQPHETALDFSGGIHQLVIYTDPTTGLPRLIFGTDNGIFTGVDDNGTFEGGVSTYSGGYTPDNSYSDNPITAASPYPETGPIGNRNGNLTLTQYYYGAIQPSTQAAPGDLIYGGAHEVGAPASNSATLSTSDTKATATETTTPYASDSGDSYGVQTDPTGSGTVYRFIPFGSAGTNFFEVQPDGSGTFISRTFGLTTGPSDTQWEGGPSNGGLTQFGNFVVNSVNGSQIVITSNTGAIYRTENEGETWFQIGTTPNGQYAPAVAYGAPASSGSSTDNNIYAGTLGGEIIYTNNGGGTWSNISGGLDGSTVQQIVTDPKFGSTDAYAITLGSFSTKTYKGSTNQSFSNTNLYSNTINVPANGDTLSDLAINLNLALTSGTDSDLKITLTAPYNNPATGLPMVYTLADGVGGTGTAFTNTTFNDNATQTINSSGASAPFPGTYKIQNGVVMVNVAGVPPTTGVGNGQSVAGNWTLSVAAATATPTATFAGTVTSWSLSYSHQAAAAVYYNSNPSTGTWTNITGDLNPVTFPNLGETNGAPMGLTSLQVDWNYQIPDNPADPSGPTHPVLYVSASNGVYRSLDQGASWTLFPSNTSEYDSTNTSLDELPNDVGGIGSSAAGGYLSSAEVTDLNIAQGNVNVNNGEPTWQTGDPKVLLASTYGNNQYTINLAPTVIPNANTSAAGWTQISLPTGTTSGVYTANNGTQVADDTLTSSVVVTGYSAVSNYGNTITVKLYNLTGYTSGVVPSLNLSATTDPNTGKFSITVPLSDFGTIPSTGAIVTIGMQATDQTGATGNMAPYSFIIENPKTAAPTSVVLDATTDSGSSDGDQYTNFNNSTSSNSPLFDVNGVIVPPSADDETTVILYRASEVDGVVGAFQAVNTQTYTPSEISNISGNFGTVQIADTNAGNGAIPDTPLNSIIDTAPGQLNQSTINQYVYEAVQIDYLDYQSGPSPTEGVIIDTTAPAAPTSVSLDPSTDSGTSNSDGYTNFNNSINSGPHDNAPIFDVAGIEPNATVELFRTNTVTGVTTLVNSEQFSSSQFVAGSQSATTQLGTVQIADINGNNTTIPDSPLSTPIDTAPVGTTQYNGYTYSAIQIDLAGNPSGASKTAFGNKGAIVLDGTDADNHGGNNGTANTTGWLYMQKVVEAIAPNVTDGHKVLVALGADPSIDAGKVLTSSSAVYGIYDAFEASGLPAQGWTLEYIAGTANITSYLAGQSTPALTVTDGAAPNVSMAQTGLLYIPTIGHVQDGLTNAELQVIDNNGLSILSYVNTGGGLYTQTENEGAAGFGQGGGQTAADYGWLSALFPTISVVSESNAPAVNIQLTGEGQSIFPGLTDADLSGGPWHNYFAGTLPTSLAVMFTAQDPSNSSQQDNLGLSSVGNPAATATTGAQVIIDSTPPLQSVITLDASTDSGSLNNDQITNDNNSNNNPPLFDITNIEPNDIVNLYRTPGTVNAQGAFTASGPAVLVNTQTQGASGGLGNWQIADTNAGNGTIPDGFYLYTNTETDLAGNLGPASAGVVVDIRSAAPTAPTKVVLDPSTDSGSSDTDQYTNFNNSTATNSPILDVYGVSVPPSSPSGEYTTVTLERATETDGVVGAFSVVNTQTYAASYFTAANGYNGFVQIADTNNGAGTIADTPINSIIDTAPGQLNSKTINQYVYEAIQTDYVGNPSSASPTDGVIIDTTAPPAPTSVTLDPSTDSGRPGAPASDGYTNFNNSDNNAPLFDVAGIEPNATVELFRTDEATGQTVLVNTEQFTSAQFVAGSQSATTQLGTVQIADINGNNSTIPDSTLSTPIDTAPAGTTTFNGYLYSAIQIDLAGNPSGQSQTSFGNKGAIVLDGTDADNHGSISNGVNVNGWLYMQKVVQAIEPNITNGQKVLVALGADPSIDAGKVLTSSSAVYGIYNAFEQATVNGSTLASQGWTLEYVAGTQNVTNYLDGLSATAVNVTDASVGNITMAKTGFLYIPTYGHVSDALTTAELGVIDNSGLSILSYVNGGGGLYTQTEDESAGGFGTGGGGQTVADYGWLSSLFPSVQVVSQSSASPPPNIQITPQGQAIFPGLTSADLSGGPWHNYFAGTLPSSLTVMFTDTNPSDPGNPGDTVAVGLSSVGSFNTAPTAGAEVIIDSTPPVVPTLAINPATVSGQTFQGLIYTNYNDSNNNPPVFNAGNVEYNGQVDLYRTPGSYNTTTGVFTPSGPAVEVNTVVSATGGVQAIGDINATYVNGLPTTSNTIPNGTYEYTVQDVDLAGNALPAGSPVYVVINATPPAAPLTIHLDTTTDTGPIPGAPYNGDSVTQDNNGNPYPAPLFDITGIQKYATVELFRQSVVNGIPTGVPVLVDSLTDTVPTGSTDLVQILDTNAGNGAIANGIYYYTAKEVDLAANSSPQTVPGTDVTILSTPPQPNPPAAPVLDPKSQTGTGVDITQDDNSSKFPAPNFFAGDATGDAIAGTYTVDLLRAPVDTSTGAVGTPVVVNRLVDTAGGIISIPDINGTINPTTGLPIAGGTIPDGTYMYYIQLIDLAGNIGSISPGLQVVIDTATPAIPSPLHLDASTDTGVSDTDGITQIVQGTHPIFDVGGVLKGATLTLYRAPINAVTGVVGTAVAVNTIVNVQPGGLTQIDDPNSIPDGKYQYSVRQVDDAGNVGPIGSAITVIYDNQQPPLSDMSKLTLDPSDTGVSTSGSTTTISDTSPIFDVTVTFPLNSQGFNFNSPAKLTLVRDGVVVNPVVSTLSPDQLSYYTVTGGLVKIQDPGPVPLGVHSYQVYLTDLAGNSSPLSAPLTLTFAPTPPGTIVLDPGSDSGVKGDDITNDSKPTFDVTLAASAAGSTLRLLQAGLTVTTVQVPANFNGGVIQITEPNTLSNGSYSFSSQLVSSTGSASPDGSSVTITISTTPPIAPTQVKLDPSSQSVVDSDTTNFNGGPGLPLQFDASGIVNGATVNLYRSTFNAKTGVIGTPLLVNSLTFATPINGSVSINDVGGPGNLPGAMTVPDGTYQYTIQQTNPAGNTSPSSSPVTVTINTTPAATPTITLDPASNTGSSTTSPYTTTVIAPYFDVSNVAVGATVSLYRNGLTTPVTTLSNVQPVNGVIKIQDPGPLSNAQYTYYATQTNAAGTVSSPSPSITLNVSNTVPATPTIPKLSLDVSTDTGVVGDDITSDRLLVIDGIADPGVVINLYNVTGTTPIFLATTSANGLGQFQIALPSKLNDGNYSFAATATNSKQVSSALSAATPLVVHVVTVAGDYSGANKTSLALARRTSPSLMQWFVNGDSALATSNFGSGSLDVSLQGDFLGIGVDEPAVYRPSTAQWFALVPQNMSTNPPSGYVGELLGAFGAPNLDIPAPGNYAGTNVSELAVYRPTNGEYFVRSSAINATTTTTVQYNLGVINGTPVPGNYTNVAGAADEPAVFKGSINGDTWTIVTGGTGASTTTKTVNFGGGTGDVPVPGNYDTVPAYGQTATYSGTEEAVWQPSSGRFIVDGPTVGRIYQFDPGDIPVPGDYGGLGVTEPAVYRPSTGQWFVYTPSTNPATGPVLLNTFGDSTTAAQFTPPAAPYAYRMLPSTVSPGISAASVTSNLNFGASAASMVAPAPASTVQVFGSASAFQASQSAALTTSTPAVTPKVRPAQAATTTGTPIRVLAAEHLVDHALAAVKVKHKGLLNDPFENL